MMVLFVVITTLDPIAVVDTSVVFGSECVIANVSSDSRVVLLLLLLCHHQQLHHRQQQQQQEQC